VSQKKESGAHSSIPVNNDLNVLDDSDSQKILPKFVPLSKKKFMQFSTLFEEKKKKVIYLLHYVNSMQTLEVGVKM